MSLFSFLNGAFALQFYSLHNKVLRHSPFAVLRLVIDSWAVL